MSAWIDQMFDADQIKKRGIVRRAKTDVKKYASLDDLKEEVRKRGYLLFENDNEYLVLCDSSKLRPVAL